MNSSSKTVVVVVALAIASLSLAGDAESPWDFKTIQAKGAVARYEKDRERETLKYERQLATIRAQHAVTIKRMHSELIEDLEKAQATATKTENLDEAVRIRDAVESLKKGQQPPEPEKSLPDRTKSKRTAEELNELLAGTSWHLAHGDGGGYTLEFRKDHTFFRSKYGVMGPWASLDGSTVITRLWTPKDSIIRFIVDAGGQVFMGDQKLKRVK